MLRLPPGSRIDRFEIKSLIGSGGMGTLYLARDTSPNTYRLVALKLLNANLDSEELRDRFAREARALASLSHPNVVNIYECGEYRGSPYIVMEYVRGETLAEKIKRKAPLSLSDKLKLMMELCAGLAHAHESGIIHRDIKPANLMVDHHGRLRLLDFGIARVVESGGVTMAGLHVTQVAMRIGTPGYMSPEQYEGAEIDRRSDIFAVGAVFYELLAYREAFPGSTTRQIERRVLESEPERLTSQIPDLDPEIEAVVTKALQKDPDKRFQDAVQMERALTKVWWRLGLAESIQSSPRPTPPPAPGSGRKASRADAAYQRALAAFNEGAPETARRYAMEALAEDSKHEGARRFLEKHDPSFKLPPPSPPPLPVDDDVLEPTIVSTRSELNLPAMNATQEATLVSVPTPRRRTPASQKAATPSRKKASTPGGSIWSTYGFAIAAVGIAVVVGAAVLIAVLMRDWGGTGSGHLLTITRPANGTIVGDGINCGTGGSDCSEVIEPEGTVSLQLLPDEGYAASGYTDDCAPIGRVRMSGPRTCGATFVRVPETVNSAASGGVRHTLTVFATEGGVVRIGDTDCRATRTGCSHTFSAGQVVDLEAQADRGYTFERFTGACDVDGRVVMNAPQTCGASFVPNTANARPTGQQTGGPLRPVPPPPGTTKTPPGTGTTGTTANNTRPGTPGPGATPGAGPGGVATPGGTASPGTPGAGTPASPGGQLASGDRALPPPPPGTDDKTPPGGLIPPPPPELPAPDVQAKTEIGNLLERYRKAYQARDFASVQAEWPTAHPNVGAMLRDLTELVYQFQGEPKVVDLQLQKGMAVVEVPVKIVETKGRSKSSRDMIATITVSKVNAQNRWVIRTINHKLAG